ncbi:PREDICTED: uncharacterized protein C1orf141 homolog isoform X2 [Chinchilla lanigera]|uniref:Uncharacterized protein n=1 Tax=Chinchilla lanigera TaxID=34839 RepID=A0A8C2V3V3_CHILA|nr:PREDICTED: uncharacterized protein C1orf141 homolog isoform X2 [Chinchilla lanigera]XP_013369942.1 PREDICTED: uncharacterized protein C1orf141 homolog isoform X2 [Chinchilla lanigera]XP_013369943.1 PREDICTED: uncharacterized protein C1orf141 homolog isoform X2 [Chinchilla lanigera]XP_013369944.1 PREDICTED: uncharacterized protein C1orf141 homolog isoform X2 [Chinchilla lanigera]XP_013369945.1 PREDICTED: uncharacterized protein C1orf141 homolog isoform X2 [Chinchilla lanigera]XP_013369946.1 
MMAERVLQKLDVLDVRAKALLDRRAEKNRLQNEEKRKTLVIPLTFDFHLEFEEAVAVPTSKTASKIRADKSCDTKKPKKFISLQRQPEPIKSDFEKSDLRPHIVPLNIKNQEKSKIEENLKSRSRRTFHFLKDTAEAENSQHIQGFRKPLGSSIFSPTLSNQSNAYKKEKDSTSFAVQLENKTSEPLASTGHLEDSGNERTEYPPPGADWRSGENQSATRSGRRVGLLPLCFEDELKNPAAKIIHAPPAAARSAPSHTVQDNSKPIIFHDTQYVQTLLLTKNSFPDCILENEKIHPCKRTNFVLERNYEILKSLINGESVTLSKPKRTVRTAGRRDVQARSYEMGHRTTKNKLKTKTRDPTLEPRSGSAPHDFSQTLSSLRRKAMYYLDGTANQERSAAAVKFGRLFSTVKTSPPRFNALPLKSHSKPLRHILDLRKLNNATPLDDLLHLPKEN